MDNDDSDAANDAIIISIIINIEMTDNNNYWRSLVSNAL